MKAKRICILAVAVLPWLATGQPLPTPPSAVTKTGRFGLRYTFVGQTLLQQGIDNEPNHRLRIENLGSSTKTQVRVEFMGLNADGSTPTLSGGGFAVFPNGGYVHLRVGDSTVAQGWSAGWRECSCILDGINDKLVRFIVTYDSAYYGPDGLKDGDITLKDTILQPIKILQKSGSNLTSLSTALQTDASQTLAGYFVIPSYIRDKTSFRTVSLATNGNSWPLFPSSTPHIRFVDSLGNRYGYFNLKVNPRADYRIQADFNTTSPSLFVPAANIVVPSSASQANLIATALPYGKAQFTVDSTVTYETETGFWRTVFAAGDSSVTVFPGQENWFGNTTDAKNALRAKSKIMKFSVASATYGQKLWERAIPFESWGGAVSTDGKVVAYMINQGGREANLHTNPAIDWVGILDGATGTRKWGLTGNTATMEGLEVGLSSKGEYLALGTTGSGRLTLYRNNGSTGTLLWSNPVDFPGGDVHIGQVRKIVFSPDDQYLYVGSGDMYLRKYRVSDGSLLWKAYIGGWPFVNGIAIANGFIATGTKSKDRTLVRDSDGAVVYFSPTFGFDASIDSSFQGPVFGFGPLVTDRNSGRAIASIGGNAVKHAILDGQFALMTDTRVDVYARYGGLPLAGRNTWMGGGSGENTQSGWASPTGDKAMLAARDLTSGTFPRKGVAFFKITRSINRFPTMDSIGAKAFPVGDSTRFKVSYRDFSDYNTPSTALTLKVTADTSGLKAILRGDSVIVYAAGFAGTGHLTVSVEESSTTEKFAVSERLAVTVTCTAPSAPTAAVTTASYCVGESASPLSATPAAGSTLAWYTAATGGSGSPTAPTPSTTTAGTFNYYAASSINGCESASRLPFTVTVKPAPSATVSGNATVCLNATAPSVTFTGSGATTPYTFHYTLNGGSTQTAVSSGTGNTASLTQSTAVKGSFAFTLTRVASANGCASNLSAAAVTVKVNPIPSAGVSGGGQVCLNGTPTPFTLTGSNGDAPYTFTFSVNGGAPQQQSTQSGSSTLTFSPPTNAIGNTTLSLQRVSDANGTTCQQNVTGSASLTVNAIPPKPTISKDANGNLVSSAASGNQWYRDGTPVNGATGQTYLPTATGNYTVVVTVNGCASAASDPFNYTPTGLVQLGEGQYLRIWPNPTETDIRIEFRIQGTSQIQAILHDIGGREVWRKGRVSSGEGIPTDRLSAGTYLLTTTDTKGRVLHRERIVVR